MDSQHQSSGQQDRRVFSIPLNGFFKQAIAKATTATSNFQFH
jgi:hypothetical protein